MQRAALLVAFLFLFLRGRKGAHSAKTPWIEMHISTAAYSIGLYTAPDGQTSNRYRLSVIQCSDSKLLSLFVVHLLGRTCAALLYGAITFESCD